MIIEIHHRQTGAVLRTVEVESLQGANLGGANLGDAYLGDAYLRDAYLRGAYLGGANLRDANLGDAVMPDGRSWEAYRADPLAGICQEPEARERAIAAWGRHTWQDCPMHAALGISSIDQAPEDTRLLVAAFVALFDGGLLPRPTLQPEPVAA